MRQDRDSAIAISAVRSSPVPPVLRDVWFTAVLLTCASVIFSIMAYRFGWRSEFYQALSRPGEHFSDFSVYLDKFQYLHTEDFFDSGYPFTYPGAAACLFAFFYAMGQYRLTYFLIVSGLALVVPAAFFGRALLHKGLSPRSAFGFAATLLACSWPGILVFDRGNIEVIVWAALALGIWAFITERPYVAAACFGVAAALKLFPFVYFALFLPTRRWKPLGVSVAVFLGLSIAGLWFVGPTIPIAYDGISDGLLWFKESYMGSWRVWESGVDHSLFGLVKFLGLQLFGQDLRTSFVSELTVYTYVTAVGGILLYFLRIRLLPITNQILALCIASILFTGFSGDGTLLHLYCGFALLSFVAVEAQKRRVRVAGLRAALLLCAFIFSYESFFAKPTQRFEGQVKCAALCALMFVVLRYPFLLAAEMRKAEAV